MIGIYCVHNLINDKRYIGQSTCVEGRLWEHRTGYEDPVRHSNAHLQSSIKKYGVENFEFMLLEECPREMLNEREKYWIAYYHSNDREYGYNKTSGGDGTPGFIPDDEIRAKLSEAQLRLWSTDSHRKMMSEHRLNHYVSNETKSKIGARSKERMNRPEEIEKLKKRMYGNKYGSGTVSVYRIIDGVLENKRIPPNELDNYLSQGYLRGRGPNSIPRIKL